MPRLEWVPTNRITVPEWQRIDVDRPALRKSIERFGPIVPIGLRSDYSLVYNREVFEECRRLGMEKVLAVIGEYENPKLTSLVQYIQHQPLSPYDAVRVAKYLRAEGGKLPGGGRQNKLIADHTGRSRRTLENEEYVYDAIQADPVRYGHFEKAMKEKSSVHREYKLIKRDRQCRALESIAPPRGKYGLATVDPPWEIQTSDGTPLPYPTMTDDEIASLGIPQLAASPGMWTFLWVPQSKYSVGESILRRYGVESRIWSLCWVKSTGGVPGNHGIRHMHETCLFGAIGSPPAFHPHIESVIYGQPTIRMHSSKPASFYEMLVRSSAGPRLAMFDRGKRPGFVTWGAEADTTWSDVLDPEYVKGCDGAGILEFPMTDGLSA